MKREMRDQVGMLEKNIIIPPDEDASNRVFFPSFTEKSCPQRACVQAKYISVELMSMRLLDFKLRKEQTDAVKMELAI